MGMRKCLKVSGDHERMKGKKRKKSIPIEKGKGVEADGMLQKEGGVEAEMRWKSAKRVK
jgi:hypothetical protein